MKTAIWMLFVGAAVGVAYLVWRARERASERRRASQEREATFLAQAMGATAPKPAATAPTAAAPAAQERLLLEAASKAADAGEPALSIQLYARLLSRFPGSTLAAQARAAADTQKKKLSTATGPGTAAPG